MNYEWHLMIAVGKVGELKMSLIVLTDSSTTSVGHRSCARPSLAAPHPTTSQAAARYACLLKLCRARGCTHEDAKELVQEAHLRLLQYLRSANVRDEDSLLRRIVINLSTTYYYRELSTPWVFESAYKLDRCGLLVDPRPEPERTLAAEQQLDGVVNLLSAVSRRTCQVFIAQRAGYRYEEIAQAYWIAERTVEKHIATAQFLLFDYMNRGY